MFHPQSMWDNGLFMPLPLFFNSMELLMKRLLFYKNVDVLHVFWPVIIVWCELVSFCMHGAVQNQNMEPLQMWIVTFMCLSAENVAYHERWAWIWKRKSFVQTLTAPLLHEVLFLYILRLLFGREPLNLLFLPSQQWLPLSFWHMPCWKCFNR